jgi:preprotein translocase subunit SecD
MHSKTASRCRSRHSRQPDGITSLAGDGLEIGGGMTAAFASDIATVLKFGPLPIGLERIG